VQQGNSLRPTWSAAVGLAAFGFDKAIASGQNGVQLSHPLQNGERQLEVAFDALHQLAVGELNPSHWIDEATSYRHNV
jgi:hypothetical protein